MALKVLGGGPVVARLAEAGVDPMAAPSKAPARGVIRNEQTGHARRVSAGSPIPKGWSFDKGDASKKSASRPKENTKAEGPTETPEGTPPDVVAEAGTVVDRRTERRQS